MKEIRLLDTEFDNFDFTKLGAYEVIEDGSDDVYIIQNYPQRYLYKIEGDFDPKKLEYMGYKVVDGDVIKDEVVLIEKTFETFHIVQPCETLYSIAQTYNTTPEVIIETNNINNKLFIGQILKID